MFNAQKIRRELRTEFLASHLTCILKTMANATAQTSPPRPSSLSAPLRQHESRVSLVGFRLMNPNYQANGTDTMGWRTSLSRASSACSAHGCSPSSSRVRVLMARAARVIDSFAYMCADIRLRI